MSSTFNARSAAAYEHFMGRWSRQLAARFVEFAGIRDDDCILMLDAEPEASPAFCPNPLA